MPLVSSIFLCTLHVYLAIATPINVTVDDRYGAWPAFGISQSINYGQGWFDSGLDKCNGCQFSPNFTGFGTAVNGTWKRATYQRDMPQDEPKTATFAFNGTAVYVNILRSPVTATGIKGNIELLFSLDGVVSRILEDDVPPFVFTQTAFSQSSLPHGEHTLNIQNGDPNGAHDEAMVFLDSIVYTIDDSLLPIPMSTISESPTPLSSNSSGGANRGVIIAVGVLGGVAGILLITVSFLILRQIRRRWSKQASSIKSPTSSDPSKRNPLVAVPFLKALHSSSLANGRKSSDLDPLRFLGGGGQRLQSRPTIRTLASTRPPSYRTRDSLATEFVR